MSDPVLDGMRFGDAERVRLYDEVLVPRLFEPWGRRLLLFVALQADEKVLDVACGPGTVARLAAAQVGDGGEVTGLDVSEAMIARGREKGAGEIPLGRAIDFVLGSADALPFPERRFDVVLCQQGLQFFPDRKAALAEMYRVLKPAGRVGLSMWTRVEENTMFHAIEQSLEDVGAPAETVAAAGRAFTGPDEQTLSRLIEDAGFERVQVESARQPMLFGKGARQAAESWHAFPVGPWVQRLPEAQRAAFQKSLETRLLPLEKRGALAAVTTTYLARARKPRS